jgi:hypothetical protein
MAKHSLAVEGIVAVRDKEPYILLFKNEVKLAQLTMAQARSFAHDILVQCSRSEADAMIHRFFAREEYPPEAANALMLEFRDFRNRLDGQMVEKSVSRPSGDDAPRSGGP